MGDWIVRLDSTFILLSPDEFERLFKN